MEPAKVKDVVCGMTIDPAKAAGSSEYKGRQYYFCSKGCKTKFDADPEKYLAPPAAAAPAHSHAGHGSQQAARTEAAPAPAGNVEYTCPMHP